MHRPEGWLEPVLASELGRVRAPEELWKRIETPKTRTRMRMPVLHAVAAATLIALALWSSYPRVQAIQSSDSVRIREWIKANSGLEIPLLTELPVSLRLTGARIVRGRAEVGCRIGDRDIKLVVAKAESGVSHVHNHPNGGRSVSWAMHGQSYSLFCARPEDLKAACLLCHVGGA